MELIAFLAVVFLVCSVSFWLLGALYGLVVHRPAIIFPPSLSLKMALGAIAGFVILGFGGIIFSTWLMNIEFAKRADYRRLSCIVAGVIISAIASAITLFSAYGLAWSILG